MPLTDKLVGTLEELHDISAELHRQGSRIVFTNGCFDLLHRGHVEYLCRAREQGDALIVALNSDSSTRELKGDYVRPLIPQADRAFMLAALACVDYVYIFDSPRCDRVIRAVRPDIYVKSKPYSRESLNADELAALDDCGAQLVFTECVEGYSTSDLIRRIGTLPPE